LPIGKPSLIWCVWPRWSKSAKSTIVGNTVLNQDFREFIQLLNENSVRYLVVGGYAVALHGHPRYTRDIDIWIGSTTENATKLIKVLDQFGFGSLGLRAEDFLVLDQIVQLGDPPNRIDLLTSLPGVDFDSCYAERVQVRMDELDVNFIDLDNLKISKRATGRLQDLADLESLQ
jgi:hypothetical protein